MVEVGSGEFEAEVWVSTEDAIQRWQLGNRRCSGHSVATVWKRAFGLDVYFSMAKFRILGRVLE